MTMQPCLLKGMNQLDKSMLHLACEVGAMDVARYLLESGARINAADGWFQTPLFYCINTRRCDLTELLLSYKRGDINHQDRCALLEILVCLNL